MSRSRSTSTTPRRHAPTRSRTCSRCSQQLPAVAIRDLRGQGTQACERAPARLRREPDHHRERHVLGISRRRSASPSRTRANTKQITAALGVRARRQPGSSMQPSPASRGPRLPRRARPAFRDHQHASRLGLFCLSVIMLVSAVVLVANTLRMGLFARRKEISIMRLVGATNWRIRVPFLIEGGAEALLGAGLAISPVPRQGLRRRPARGKLVWLPLVAQQRRDGRRARVSSSPRSSSRPRRHDRHAPVPRRVACAR